MGCGVTCWTTVTIQPGVMGWSLVPDAAVRMCSAAVGRVRRNTGSMRTASRSLGWDDGLDDQVSKAPAQSFASGSVSCRPSETRQRSPRRMRQRSRCRRKFAQAPPTKKVEDHLLLRRAQPVSITTAPLTIARASRGVETAVLARSQLRPRAWPARNRLSRRDRRAPAGTRETGRQWPSRQAEAQRTPQTTQE